MSSLRILSAAYMFLCAGSVAADTFCADLDALAEHGATQGLMLSETLIPMAAQAGECRTSRALSGARHVQCSWSFGYRAVEAAEVFEGLTARVAACLGSEATMTSDSSVNHPDAYDLRMFDRYGQAFAVSVKDKGALQQTLVFIRAQQR